jgi:spoIIIJ-associated protein
VEATPPAADPAPVQDVIEDIAEDIAEDFAEDVAESAAEAVDEDAADETVAEASLETEAASDDDSADSADFTDAPTAATVETDEDSGDETAEETGDAADSDELTLEELAADLLSEMLSLMNLDARVVPAWDDSEDHRTLVLDIQGRDLGVLIGRHGSTLASIQYLLRLMINQRLKAWPSVVVDVEQYKANRKDRLTQMAMRMAEQVMESGQPIAMEPMPPADRRLIHLALRSHPSVYTRSTGDDDRRKVQILLKE